MELQLRPDRPAYRHPRHAPNPYRVWLATGAANRECASQIAGLIQVQPFGWFHPSGLLPIEEYRRAFDRACAKVGIEGLTSHGLRHTTASLAISAGANVKVVQRMLGHATAAMTVDRYGHPFDDDLTGVADALGKAIESTAVRVGSRREGWIAEKSVLAG